MPDELDNKIQILINNHYSPSNPQQWTSLSYEDKLQHVKNDLRAKTIPFESIATALLATIYPILDELSQAEAHRFVCRIDCTHMAKSPDSILEKMGREWIAKQKKNEVTVNPPIDFATIQEITDLARFRIVTNFLSDAEQVKQILSAPYAHQPQLSKSQQILQTDFQLDGNNFDDNIHVTPDHRNKGERCYKGLFYPRQSPQFKVEVQIVTMLQEAWDKKDHFLIYEPRRQGKTIKPSYSREIFAISETLYLLELQFDHLKERMKSEEE